MGLPIAFSSAGSGDTDGTIASYHWDFADGTSATTANPSSSDRTPIKVATIPPPISINANPANNAQVAQTIEVVTGSSAETSAEADEADDDRSTRSSTSRIVNRKRIRMRRGERRASPL